MKRRAKGGVGSRREEDRSKRGGGERDNETQNTKREIRGAGWRLSFRSI